MTDRDQPVKSRRRRLTALALAAAAAFTAAGPPAAAGSTSAELQRAATAFAVPSPTAVPRDLVIQQAGAAQTRLMESPREARYDVHDGAGRSVDITESTTCATSCDTTPQTIANFFGTLPHGDEMNLLSVLMVTPAEMSSPAACGAPDILSCYYEDENLMVISGDDFIEPDNATRNYVVAHEYGHHLANHRDNSPFANPAIDWGPKNWASFAGVCQGVRSGRYFPGDEGARYYDDPGEAFAESFAQAVFPSSGVPWEWPDFPDPHSGAFPAILLDAASPWTGPGLAGRQGHFPKKRRPRRKTKLFPTPRDGDFSLTLRGPNRADLVLKLFGPDGTQLASSDAFGSHEQVTFQVCGERGLTAIVRRHGRRLTRFKFAALVP